MSCALGLAIKELRQHLPFFCGLTLLNRWLLGVAMFQFDKLTSTTLMNLTLLTGRWTDDSAITFTFFGFVFFAWGYRTVSREWQARTAVWLRSLPIKDGAAVLIKLGVGAALICAIFLIDVVAVVAVRNLTHANLSPRFGEFMLRGKTIVAAIYLTWFLAGAAAAHLRLRTKTLRLTVVVLAPLVLLGPSTLLLIVGSGLQVVELHLAKTLVGHGLVAALSLWFVLRAAPRLQVV